MRVQIKVDGLDKVLNRYGRASNRLKRGLQDAIKQSAFEIEKEAKRQATIMVYSRPQRGSYRRTGNLRSRIHTRMFESSASVRTGTHYSIYVHEGTRYVEPRPFMTEGAEQASPRVRKIFQNALKNSLS